MFAAINHSFAMPFLFCCGQKIYFSYDEVSKALVSEGERRAVASPHKHALLTGCHGTGMLLDKGSAFLKSTSGQQMK